VETLEPTAQLARIVSAERSTAKPHASRLSRIPTPSLEHERNRYERHVLEALPKPLEGLGPWWIQHQRAERNRVREYAYVSRLR
jgi:hypothetical protein